MSRFSLVLVFLFALALAAPNAFALSLDAARNQGLVGETQEGYVAAVGSGNSQVDRLVADVNAKRRSRYSQIAQSNGLSVSDVARQAGAKLTAKASRGQYVRMNQKWQKK